MRPQRFRTHYLWTAGVLMVLAEDFVTLVRLCDGHCKTFTYEMLGLSAAGEKGAVGNG